MAMYISVPRDLTRVKTKVFFNLTKKQIWSEFENVYDVQDLRMR